MGHKDTIKENLSHLGKAYVGVEIVTASDGSDKPTLWHCSIGNEGDDIGIVSFHSEDLEEAVKCCVDRYISLVEQNKQMDW